MKIKGIIVFVALFWPFTALPGASAARAYAVPSFNCEEMPLHLVESRQKYPRFKPADRVLSVGGYGIYSNLPVPKSSLSVLDGGSVLIDFMMKPGQRIDPLLIKLAKSDIGFWYSARREFTKPLNLKSAKGIELSFTVLEPSKLLRLRLSLTDLVGFYEMRKARKEGGLKPAGWLPNTLSREDKIGGGSKKKVRYVMRDDWMWAYDLPDNTFRKEGSQVVRIPFNRFSFFPVEPTKYPPERSLSTSFSYEVVVLGYGKVKLRVDSVKCY